MAFDEWTNLNEGEVDELFDSNVRLCDLRYFRKFYRHLRVCAQVFEGKRDILLFCIDCSESMQALRPDPRREGQQTNHLLDSLEAAVQIQKRKVIVGPGDSVGILFFNTVNNT